MLPYCFKHMVYTTNCTPQVPQLYRIARVFDANYTHKGELS